MELTKEKLQQLNKLGLRLEHYFVLWSKAESLALLPYYKVDNSIYTDLMNKGYLSLSKNITKDGIKLIAPVEETQEWREHFEKWWNLYPSTDKIDHHPRSRSLRGNKAAAERYYKRIYERSDDGMHRKIYAGLQNHIQSFTSRTKLTGDNAFKYFPSASKWLNNELWDVWYESDSGNSDRPPKSGRIKIS
jgi:hypothetical protein